MLKDRVNDMFDKMSYEKQKEALRVLEDHQAYDDNCNVVEVVVEATVAAVKALVKLIF